jgi:hypothetical protein
MMSHIVSIKTKIKDPAALATACRRLGLTEPTTGTARLFSSQATGTIVQLPGWTFPIIIDAANGDIQYDNFNGAWGEEAQLHRLLQAYAVEKAKLEARRSGHSVLEQPLADGSIRLTIQVGGAE